MTESFTISVNFTVSKPTQWIGYSLDGDDNVTVTGNITLSDVPPGLHNMTVYAIDVYGISGASETVYFNVAKEPEQELSPTELIVASIVIVAVVGIGLLIYFKKRKL